MRSLGAAAGATGLGQIARTVRFDENPVTSTDRGRLYLSTALRAAGDYAESLIVAEGVLQRVGARDASSHRLATLEVAASLLALGDSSESEDLVRAIIEAGFEGNQSHEFRAAMILAEIECRNGHFERAVARLRGDEKYLLSGDACWQAAAYCGAFPRLLGVMATAVAPQVLPEQLVQMIPVTHADRILDAMEPWVDPLLLRRLGNSLVGEAEMDRRHACRTVPLCRVRMFGGLDVRIGERIIRDRDWTKRKARALFIILASRRGQDIAREQLMESLWPGMDEERARNNLYVAWSTMKSVLGGPLGTGGSSPYVVSVGGVCRVDRNTVRSDLDEFEEQLLAARIARPVVGRVDALTAYDRIADLCSGGLLPGDVYDDLLACTREYYRSEFTDAMLSAGRLLIDACQPAAAMRFLRRAIHADPLREDLYQLLLRCQVAEGQRSSAIETYSQCCERLFEELGLSPSDETRALYDVIVSMQELPIIVPLSPV